MSEQQPLLVHKPNPNPESWFIDCRRHGRIKLNDPELGEVLCCKACEVERRRILEQQAVPGHIDEFIEECISVAWREGRERLATDLLRLTQSAATVKGDWLTEILGRQSTLLEPVGDLDERIAWIRSAARARIEARAEAAKRQAEWVKQHSQSTQSAAS